MPIDEEERERIMKQCVALLPSHWTIADKCYKRCNILGRGSWAMAFNAKLIIGSGQETKAVKQSIVALSECKSHEQKDEKTESKAKPMMLLNAWAPSQIAVKAVVKKAHSHRSLEKYSKREVNIMRKLVTHPNVVKLLASGEDEHCFYLAMELCPNRSLSTVVKSRERPINLNNDQIKRFITEMLQGCQYIHSHLIVHRDLKPDNILLAANNRIKIGDFGLSVELKSASDVLHSVCGTPKYQAPEMLRKTGYSFAVDVWAIGCIVYRLYYQVPPYDGPDSKAIYAKVLTCHVTYPKFNRFHRVMGDEELRLIRSMLKKNPKLRASIESLLVAKLSPHTTRIICPDCKAFDKQVK